MILYHFSHLLYAQGTNYNMLLLSPTFKRKKIFEADSQIDVSIHGYVENRPVAWTQSR